MKAGYELDSLVAVKVLGWREAPCFTCGAGPLERHRRDCRALLDIANRLPCFSVDIADAWRVVERFPTMSIQHQNEGWYVSFYSDITAHAIADTAPMAICLAALKAVGVVV